MAQKLDLTTNVQFLKGVGPVRARSLARLGIETVSDLILHFPRTWIDRSNITKISTLSPESEATICGEILTCGQRRVRGGKTIQSVTVGDHGGVLTCTWFGQSYILKQLKAGQKVLVSGKVQFHNGRPQFVHPDYDIISDETDSLHSGRMVPVYPLTSGIGQHWLRSLIFNTLNYIDELIEEFIPTDLLSKHRFPERSDAIKQMHFPENSKKMEAALARFIYEEIILIQAVMLLRKNGSITYSGAKLSSPGDLTTRLVEGLSFQLTSAQRKVLSEILSDMKSGKVMHRLLQGDVGCGKTLVALLASLFVIEQGWQASIMAPTEVLAQQHGESIYKLIAPLGVSMEVLTGSTPAAQRRAILSGAAAGEIDLLVGTHALLGESVYLPNHGLAVVDEQHRFGVKQRSLASKSDCPIMPHVLVMSATPIPRSLSLTLYGDLDLSIIDELPAGRIEIITDIVQPKMVKDLHKKLKNRLNSGEQAYVIYPVIEETEGQDIKSATEEYEKMCDGEFSNYSLGLLHGRMKASQKKEIMDSFAAGEIDLLVATTVIEVGVDVPNSTTMVIHHPERFGLAQLHQLRGRVGRGDLQSFCHLVLDKWISPESYARVEYFSKTTDGFQLAEEDLRRRGPGDVMGVRQHGLPAFKIANPIRDAKWVKICNQDIIKILGADPELKKHSLFKKQIMNRYGKLLKLSGSG